MASNQASFEKQFYPVFKIKEGVIFPSSDKPPFKYQKLSYNFVRPFYDYFSPLLLRNDLREDGIYTWVLLTTGDLFAIRTLTGQETGTLHENILKYIVYRYGDEFSDPASQLVVSGELYLQTDNNSHYRRLFFNFESGTFAKLILRSKKEEEKTVLQQSLVPYVSTIFEQICPMCHIQPQLGTSFFSLFQLSTNDSILANLNTFLSRNSIVTKNNSSFNEHSKPYHLRVSKGGRRNTKGRNTKGRKTKGRKTIKKKSLSLTKK